MPEFKPTFGRLYTGAPLAEASYTELDAIIAATGAGITHHWRSKPRYDRPPLDRILLPPRSRFINDQQYHASRIHEVIHFLSIRGGRHGSALLTRASLSQSVGQDFSNLRLPHDQDNTEKTHGRGRRLENDDGKIAGPRRRSSKSNRLRNERTKRRSVMMTTRAVAPAYGSELSRDCCRVLY
jgi:hypothetical protein